jgi:hypothetical protein
MRELCIQELAFVCGGVNATNGSVIGGNGGPIEIISSNALNNNTSITVGDINTSAKAGSAHLVLPFPISFPF